MIKSTFDTETPEVSSLGLGWWPNDKINISMDHHMRLQPQHKRQGKG